MKHTFYNWHNTENLGQPQVKINSISLRSNVFRFYLVCFRCVRCFGGHTSILHSIQCSFVLCAILILFAGSPSLSLFFLFTFWQSHRQIVFIMLIEIRIAFSRKLEYEHIIPMNESSMLRTQKKEIQKTAFSTKSARLWKRAEFIAQLLCVLTVACFQWMHKHHMYIPRISYFLVCLYVVKPRCWNCCWFCRI